MMNRIDTILHQKAVRITPMRQLVLKHFLLEEAVLGLNELEDALPHSDRITLFRTLKTFEEKGIIHSIPNGSSEVKYALCQEHCEANHHLDRHPHFHCIKCKQIECLETVIIPGLPMPQGYTPQEINMTIKGICPLCQNEDCNIIA